ncbi:MAG TPA: EpsI family protein [Gemmatirosa sp.]|nr:EpsI family protein [Gemmatirosa sp.]
MADVLKFAPAALLGAGVLLISGLREQLRVPPRAPMRNIQISAPGYTKVQDVVVKAEEQRIAGMDDYVMRAFEKDSLDQFSVYVGYYTYQVQGKTIHSPKNCLPGAGWEQISWTLLPVTVAGKTYPVNRYLLGNEGRQALVYYWYQGRGRAEASEYVVKWNLLVDAAVHRRTEEALVRIVVPVNLFGVRPDSPELRARYARADSLAADVARQLGPQVDRVLPLPAA